MEQPTFLESRWESYYLLHPHDSSATKDTITTRMAKYPSIIATRQSSSSSELMFDRHPHTSGVLQQ